ncbi:unnamed protein product, partial [Brassica rapa subsp. narinosa]
ESESIYRSFTQTINQEHLVQLLTERIGAKYRSITNPKIHQF